MQRQNLVLVAVVMLVLAAMGFMGWAATRSATPAAEPAPVATPIVTARPGDQVAVETGGVVATALFTLTLPAGWQHTTQAWTGGQPAETAYLAPLMVAWQGGATFEQSPMRLSIAALPRNDLSLQQYLLDVTEQFSSTQSVSEITAHLDTDLRRDGLPAALIHYSVAMPAGELEGYQAAMLDASGSQLLLATLVHQTDGAETEALFRSLLSSLHFLEPENEKPESAR